MSGKMSTPCRAVGIRRNLLLAAAALFLAAQPAAAATISAAVGGNASDADENGSGDNHSALPGNIALLSNVGINASGGPGSNGTMRYHVEFPLAGVVGPLGSARVILTTEDAGGAFNMNTTFFAASGDGNGTLEDADFQTPALAIPGVTLTPHGSGTFAIDVTAEVNAALAASRGYFVLQGRVDESGAAGTTFDRGRQIYNTSSGNAPANLPILVTAARSSAPVPVLSSWGLILLPLLLAGWAARNGRRT